MKNLSLLAMLILLSCKKSDDPTPMPTESGSDKEYTLIVEYPSYTKMIIVLNGDTIMNRKADYAGGGYAYITIIKNCKIDYDATGNSTMKVVEHTISGDPHKSKLYIDFGIVTKGTLDLTALPE